MNGCIKCFLIFVTLSKDVLSNIDPVVELPTGKILGRQMTTFANTVYYSYQKIPYAKPPVGPLRFKSPQPVQKWDGILDATSIDVSCYQLQSNQPTDSEDCLFINVYTPKLPESDSDVLLPVMFYIHGGAFVLGSSLIVPPDLFVDNDVILVTINYRLAVFGFLSTEDEAIPGNNGLKDQKLAIEWTHENIHLFGGDPGKVTIIGQSAGSASAAYQLLNHNLLGFFQGAILESGTFLSPWAFQRNSRKRAFDVAAILNSSFTSSNNSSALLEYLQSVDAEDIDAATEQHLADTNTLWNFDASHELLWAPVIEVQNPDAFITRKMYGLLKAGNILAVPTIVGFNSEESLLFNQDPDILQTVLEVWDQNLDIIVPEDMNIIDSETLSGMGLVIRDIYTDGEPFGTSLGEAIRFSSDNSFSRPISKFAELYSEVADTYFYEFSFDGKLGNISVHYDGAESVGHSEEAFYLFCSGLGCDLSNFTESEQITSKRLVKLWTDFAKYQNPIPEASDLLQNITWPQLSVKDGNFFYLDINETLEVRNHPKAETLRKWSDLYDALDYQDFDTY